MKYISHLQQNGSRARVGSKVRNILCRRNLSEAFETSDLLVVCPVYHLLGNSMQVVGL